MELSRLTKQNLDISTAAQVIDYTYDGSKPIEVLIRVDLGNDASPIAGDATYVLDIVINDTVMSPSSAVSVPAGRTKTILQSRPFGLDPGDELVVQVTGADADTAVISVTSIRDVTPAKVDDLIGVGPVTVDHNYGGTDALTVMTSDEIRVDGATILAYRAADYQAGRKTKGYVVAQSRTTVDGRWEVPMMLDPGSYILLVYKQGVIKSKTTSLTVE